MSDADSCIIVGAGIAGLLAAQHLTRYDIDVTLIEKSRGFGGRMATKEAANNGAVFDIGAQFMTTRNVIFRERVETWLSKGEVLPWFAGPLKNMRYVGSNGMRTVPDRIGASLKARLSEKVSRVSFSKGKWTVTTVPYGSSKTRSYEAGWLILTAPVPQILELLEASEIELDYDLEVHLRRITYTRCLTVMAQLKGPSGISNPGAMDLNHDVLRWIGDNAIKGISSVPGSITLNSSPKYAEAMWDKSPEEWTEGMLAAAKPFIRSEPVSSMSHRWRYSDPEHIFQEKKPFRKPYFLDEDLHLGMAGDGFNGPRIEAAGLSGMELAAAILSPY